MRVKKQLQQQILRRPVPKLKHQQLRNLTVKLQTTKTNQATQEILNLLNQLQKRKKQNLQQVLEIKKHQWYKKKGEVAELPRLFSLYNLRYQ